MPLRPQSLDIFYATVRPRKPAAVAAAGLYNSRNQPYQKPPVMAPAAAPPPPSGGGGGSSDVASGADTGGVVDLNRILPPPHDSLFSSSKNNQTGSNSFQNKNAGKNWESAASQSLAVKSEHLRFVDESSAVLPSPSPDCGQESVP